MNRMTVMVVAAVAAATAFAEVKPMEKLPEDLGGLRYSEVPKHLREEFKARRKAEREKRTGGMLFRKGTPKGRVVFFDAQTRIDAADALAQAAALAHKKLRMTVEASKSGAVGLKDALPVLRKSAATAGVFLVDDPSLPMAMLTVPEECWAMVNVAELLKDSPEATFAKARVRKEVLRAFFATASGGTSQYDSTLVGDVKEAKDLDKLVEGVPIDVLSRTLTKLSERGMVREEFCTYHDAVSEGWAPAPTNEYQQAIWDKVHAMPKTPMKIEFDPKKGR